MSATVSYIADYRKGANNTSTISDVAVGSDVVSINTSTSGEKENNSRISTEELYPASREIRPELAKAFELLSESISYLNKAIDSYSDGDYITSDDYINRLQALLPELYCCRSLSEGFGAITTATYHSIVNFQGKTLNKIQLVSIKNILTRLNTEPYIGFEEAVDEIIILEDSGFNVEPKHFEYLADLLDD